MNRRNLLRNLLFLPALAIPEGVKIVQRENKCVLLFDPRMITVDSAMRIGRTLALPEKTPLIPVLRADGDKLEDAFAVTETSG